MTEWCDLRHTNRSVLSYIEGALRSTGQNLLIFNSWGRQGFSWRYGDQYRRAFIGVCGDAVPRHRLVTAAVRHVRVPVAAAWGLTSESSQTGTKIGYRRVSTCDQNPDAQRDALTAAGCEQVFIDKASGKLARRPELDRALLVARAGDQLVVTKLDRGLCTAMRTPGDSTS